MEKYALVNLMLKIPGCRDGVVMSTHRTLEAAVEADYRCQPGGNAYLPTSIARGDGIKKGDSILLARDLTREYVDMRQSRVAAVRDAYEVAVQPCTLV